MSIDISIEDNFDNLEGYLDDLKADAAVKAVHFSINRTLLTLRERSVQRIKERLSVKTGVLKSKHLVINKAKLGGLGFHTMKGEILYNTTPIPMIEFISGAQQKRSQKGVAVSKRKPLKARIRPGKTVTLKHAFIATVHSKQVFKRRDTSSRRVKKQGIVSVGFIFKKPLIRNELQLLGGKRFTELFVREYRRRIVQSAKRRNAKMRTRR